MVEMHALSAAELTNRLIAPHQHGGVGMSEEQAQAFCRLLTGPADAPLQWASTRPPPSPRASAGQARWTAAFDGSSGADAASISEKGGAAGETPLTQAGEIIQSASSALTSVSASVSAVAATTLTATPFLGVGKYKRGKE